MLHAPAPSRSEKTAQTKKRRKGFDMTKFTNDEMNLMCIYSAGSSRAGLMQKLTEMKKYLERDEVQLLELTESTLAKLGTMTDEEFGQLELYPDFDI